MGSVTAFQVHGLVVDCEYTVAYDTNLQISFVSWVDNDHWLVNSVWLCLSISFGVTSTLFSVLGILEPNFWLWVYFLLITTFPKLNLHSNAKTVSKLILILTWLSDTLQRLAWDHTHLAQLYSSCPNYSEKSIVFNERIIVFIRGFRFYQDKKVNLVIF